MQTCSECSQLANLFEAKSISTQAWVEGFCKTLSAEDGFLLLGQSPLYLKVDIHGSHGSARDQLSTLHKPLDVPSMGKVELVSVLQYNDRLGCGTSAVLFPWYYDGDLKPTLAGLR